MNADRDQGDECPTEVQRFVPSTWHESMKPARVPVLNNTPTEAGRRALAALLAQAKSDDKARARREPVPVASWCDVPALYRRMIVAAAGVDRAVIDKLDRDLTEREKVMLRSAVNDMRAWFSTLVTL